MYLNSLKKLFNQKIKLLKNKNDPGILTNLIKIYDTSVTEVFKKQDSKSYSELLSSVLNFYIVSGKSYKNLHLHISEAFFKYKEIKDINAIEETFINQLKKITSPGNNNILNLIEVSYFLSKVKK